MLLAFSFTRILTYQGENCIEGEDTSFDEMADCIPRPPQLRQICLQRRQRLQHRQPSARLPSPTTEERESVIERLAVQQKIASQRAQIWSYIQTVKYHSKATHDSFIILTANSNELCSRNPTYCLYVLHTKKGSCQLVIISPTKNKAPS